MLPIVIDLFRGPQNNLHFILEHLRAHRDVERHPWLNSFFYFLRFGGYKPSLGEYLFTGHATLPTRLRLLGLTLHTTQLGQFFGTHLRMTAIWLTALILPAASFGWRRRRSRAEAVAAGETSVVASVPAAPVGRWRFLAWLGVFWLLSFGLTLYWGRIQDGPMFYFNAWFNYAIYFVLALVAVGALCDTLEIVFVRARQPVVWKTAAAILCLFGTAVFLGFHFNRFDATDEDLDDARQQARTVFAALRDYPAAPRTKLLVFPHDSWDAATGVATLLARRGVPLLCEPGWENMFGDEYSASGVVSRLPWQADGDLPFEVWRVLPGQENPAARAQRPLCEGNALAIGGVDLDPNAGAAIDFAGPQPNVDLYALGGWSPADRDATFTWSEGKQGLVYFRPKPVPEGSTVEVTFDFEPYYLLGKGFAARLEMRFDNVDLGTVRMVVDRDNPPPLPSVRIPAALWNKHPAALLVLGFPDAVSPLEKGVSEDIRQIGFSSKSIRFRVVPASPPVPDKHDGSSAVVTPPAGPG